MSADALITAPEVRKLLGRGPKFALAGLPGFPGCAQRARGPYPDRYSRADIERYLGGHRFDDAQPSVSRRTKTMPGRIGLPSERAMIVSMRRDLFDENPLTAAPEPCAHWHALLCEARHPGSDAGADGHDISPATLRAEAERDRARAARSRPRLSVGYSPDVARPGAENLRLSAQPPQPARRGHKPQPITLARSVDEVLQVGA
jgi:hypothetical protein